MREIKFRAWHKELRIMLYRGLYDRNWYTTEKGGKVFKGIHPDDKYEMEVMQYIGLCDKTEADVYEGDIIDFKYKNKNYKGVVTVDEYNCYILKTNELEYNIYHIQNVISGTKIGNIHENPELL